jgi:hypothetical protein
MSGSLPCLCLYLGWAMSGLAWLSPSLRWAWAGLAALCSDFRPQLKPLPNLIQAPNSPSKGYIFLQPDLMARMYYELLGLWLSSRLVGLGLGHNFGREPGTISSIVMLMHPSDSGSLAFLSEIVRSCHFPSSVGSCSHCYTSFKPIINLASTYIYSFGVQHAKCYPKMSVHNGQIYRLALHCLLYG